MTRVAALDKIATIFADNKTIPMRRIPLWLFAIIALLYFSAARVDIMDIDASQYAEMSREMANSGSYLHLYDRGGDYLDKPPFLFWAGATSIRLFGVNNFAYKLPSILLGLLAIYATYRIARKYYNEQTGRIAALILASCQGMFLMTNDVRCDLALMGWVALATWLWDEWLDRRKNIVLFLGAAICIALGMMTKGPIGLLAPAFAVLSNRALKRQWRAVFHPAYLLMALVIGVCLIPMSIGLYQQFDLHREKFLNGHYGQSGLRFFYWTQSFGRITGENDWNNGSDISFQLVNMLWSFLPWIFLLLPALFLHYRNLARNRFQLGNNIRESLSYSGFLLCYLAVGMSKYQLPHYIFVAFPFAAIACAGLVFELTEQQRYPKLSVFFKKSLPVIGTLLFVGLLLILTVVFPAGWAWLAGCALALCIFFYVCLRPETPVKPVWIGAAAMILINIFLTHYFYYHLMSYQIGNAAGRYMHAHGIGSGDVVAYRVHDPLPSLHFYANGVVRRQELKGYLPADTGQYVLTEQEGFEELKERGYELQTVFSGRLFKVSELTPTFLGNGSRDKATRPYYLCRILHVGARMSQ
ncbi:glycosyltransferase family 39 protein [Rurimicrobium arvi]|uniref:Glycosyltransferase family 39 protein n=1 Tax=Rurimicrobium arvi TaxID=2049916 RepID=A0ABP8N0F3_9BACT